MNKFLNKIVEYGGHMTGVHTRRIGRDLEALHRFEHVGRYGVPRSTINLATDQLSKAKASSLKARVGTALGLAGAGAATYTGAKQYYDYRGNRILEKIDSLSPMDYNQY